MARRLNLGDEWKPLLPAGEYRINFLGYETAIHFGDASKLILHFSVADFGEWFETKLSRYYTVQKLIGKAGSKGRFKAKSQTSVVITKFLNYHPDTEIPKRLDRLPMNVWGSSLYLAKVGSVVTNSRQKRLHKQQQYSKILELLGPSLLP